MDSNIYLREAMPLDIDLLYEWANDSVVRNNSFNTDTIPYETHQRWFNKIMQDSSIYQFILMSDDVPIGQIRLNLDNEHKGQAEISYSIARGHRNCGYGRKILQLLREEIKTKYPAIRNLIAKVKPDNIASKKLFEKEGYDLKYCCYSLLVTPPESFSTEAE